MDACGLRHLAHDSTLESNAHQTSVEANGQLVHNMLPGTMGQVMATGDLTENFDSAFADIPKCVGLTQSGLTWLRNFIHETLSGSAILPLSNLAGWLAGPLET